MLKDRALASVADGITIADAIAPDRPLVYVNQGFARLTGYSIEETLGTNCRFLQGPDTDPAAVKAIRDAITNEQYCEVELLNYRKDGSPFWNRLSITPIRDELGNTTHFIGIQSDITRRKEAEESLRRAHTRMQNDLAAAAEIQRSLLPKTPPQNSQAQFGWAYLPCDELAGDILDVFQLSDECIGFYVLDVCGHGVQAALLSTTLSRWISRASPDLKADPVAMLEHLNEHFQIGNGTTQFFTCIYGTLHLANLQLSVASAGHPPPILLQSSGVRELDVSGFPVGVVEHPEYESQSTNLSTGDRLFFYSDGVVEQADSQGTLFGTPRLMDALAGHHAESLQNCIDLSLGTVLNDTVDGGASDDISMLGIEIL